MRSASTTIVAIVPRSSREEVRIEIVDTDAGPRVRFNRYRLHPGKAVLIACIGSFKPDALPILAEGIRDAERLLNVGGSA